VITRLEILNSRSIPALLARTAKISRAIFKSFGKIDWDFSHYDREFLTDLSRLLDKYIINLLTSSLSDDKSDSEIDGRQCFPRVTVDFRGWKERS
jgi:hypothetical protein